uniref:Uncharacterized protein n=1 Tax=Chlamydomonas sp. HS-5 TaxID=108458 RepID=Q9XFU2_9CHLO|nr:hypothetical protein [Chlamydomonas sp. HS-5]
MASGGLTGFKENEKVIEDLYFTKEDQRMLGKLLNKVKHQSDATDKHGAEGQKTAELSALAAIVSKYKISTEDMQKLVAWKHSQY